ncbi:MAG: TRAP transporter small permease subunit [Sandaracinaceae bacterium]
MQALKRFDAGIARGEAVLATLFLLSMILAASVQAIFRNLAGAEIDWANTALSSLEWVDPFLQKGTLWLAFLGASLATREGRHIGIDLLPRLAPKKAKLLMRGLAALFSSVVSFFLARAFWAAVLVNAEERPATYEVFGDTGPLHVCDATMAQVADASLEMPGIFCHVRTALAGVGVPVETPEAALQLIVPVMFVVMSARLLANGVGAFLELAQGGGSTPTVAHKASEKGEG